MAEFQAWLTSTALSQFVNNYPWVWAACETVHFLALCLLMGNVGLLDLRMLGFARSMPLRPLNEFVFWGIVGFALNLITGVMFFVATPAQYIDNPAFQLKMVFIALAGVNVGLFYFTGMARTVDALGPGEDTPVAAKIIAGSSLFLWVGVLYLGRMLPFIGNAF